MAKEILKQALSLFEQIKQTDESGNEYWAARQLAKVLEYADFRNFSTVIAKAKEACKNSGQLFENHIVAFNEMVPIGSGAHRQMKSVKLSRVDYSIFQNHGYIGLYGGLDAKGIHTKKRLKKSQQILDHMGSTELAANLFRATQTEEKLRKENIKGKQKANQTHLEVGKKVRQTIKELGGTMPEDLLAEGSIKKLENTNHKKKQKVNDKTSEGEGSTFIIQLPFA